MVNHFIRATQLRILVCQCVKAVWALRNDLAHTHAVEHLNVWHCQHLEQVFVAAATSTVARAHFAWSKNCNIDACALEQLGHRLCDFLVLVVETASTTNPVQVLVVKRRARIKHLNIEVFCPIATLALVHAPRVALVFHCAICVAQFGREVAFHQRQVTTHVENLVENFDVDRTDFIAGLATRARPHFFCGDPLKQ